MVDGFGTVVYNQYNGIMAQKHARFNLHYFTVGL